jgi:alpha-galactosidase
MVVIRESEGVQISDEMLVRLKRNDLQFQFLYAELAWIAGTTPFTKRFQLLPPVHNPNPGPLEIDVTAGPILLTAGLFASDREQHLELTWTAENLSDGPVRLLSLDLQLAVSLYRGPPEPPERLTWYRNGWQSWSFAGTICAVEPEIPLPTRDFVYRIKEDCEVPRADAAYTSDMVGALKIGDNALLMGAHRQCVFQRCRMVPGESRFSVGLHHDLDEEPLAARTSIPLGGWTFEGERTATVLARRWARRQGHRRRPEITLAGWCSWYDRFRNITADYIESNAALLSELNGLPTPRTVIIDDGYQDRVGDWLVPSRRFGAHITKMAPRITAHGHRAGVWVAPFIAQGNAQIIKTNPSWLLKDNQEKPYRIGWNPHWKGAFYALDIRHPEVLDYLHETFTTLAAAGFSVFKLDYLFAGALKAPRAYLTPGRFQAFRIALQRIRLAVGDDAILIGCGCPLSPAIDLLDVMRVTTDISYSWNTHPVIRYATGDREMTGIFPAIRNTFARSPFASSFWAVDPDCLLLRHRSGRHSAKTFEAELFGTVAGLNGDVIMIGDDLSKWTAREKTLLQQICASPGKEFIPIDSLDKTLPNWVLVNQENKLTAAAVNLDEYQEMLSLAVQPIKYYFNNVRLPSTAADNVELGEERLSVRGIDEHTSVLVDLLCDPLEGDS